MHRQLKLKLFIAALAGFGLFAAMLFFPAGTFFWLEAWLHLGLIATFVFVNGVYLMRVNPEVIEHRMKFGKGTKRWDKVWLTLTTPVFLATSLVAGLDAARFQWSPMAAWPWWLGLVLYVAGSALLSWSMGVSPFFEKTVRIQTERGHYVIDSGPYRLVRHPGYPGFLGWILSAPLLLGSWWAFLPAGLSLISLVYRTVMEDRTLRRELAGYEEYVRRVGYRLIPGIW